MGGFFNIYRSSLLSFCYTINDKFEEFVALSNLIVRANQLLLQIPVQNYLKNAFFLHIAYLYLKKPMMIQQTKFIIIALIMCDDCD